MLVVLITANKRAQQSYGTGKRRQTPGISGENFSVGRQWSTLTGSVVAEHSKAVFAAGLQVRDAALRVFLHLARLDPVSAANVLHLHHVVFDLQTAVVERRRPRQMASVLVYVEYRQRSFWRQRLAYILYKFYV